MFSWLVRICGCVIFSGLLSCSGSKKLIADKPFLDERNFRLDTLPVSDIDIPISINLRPIYSLVEKTVDTVFTSPNWPNDWVQLDCATRYKYQFRRGPLDMSARGQSLDLGFTGYYRIIGSTRVCLGNMAVSPWSPPCRCGFDEGERRVRVNFSNSVSISQDYKVNLNIARDEPRALDECQVCVFNVNVTRQVMNGLKDELDLAKKALLDSFGTVDLKSDMQSIWNRITAPFDLYGMGWLQVNPEQLRLNSMYASRDSLFLSIGMTARPIVRLDKPKDIVTMVPPLGRFSPNKGFNVFLDAILNYDSLSNLLNANVRNKRFDLDNGKKHIIINDSRIYGANNENLIIKISFSGSSEGIAYLTGQPVYDDSLQMISIRNLDFDVKTKNLLLSTAEWLFNKRIINEISNYAKFDLSEYIDSAKYVINQKLNSEIYKGVSSEGGINKITIIGFYPLSEHLIIRSNAAGQLAIRVNSIDFAL